MSKKIEFTRRVTATWDAGQVAAVSIPIEDSQYYTVIALQALGFDNNKVLTVEGSLNNTDWAPLDHTTFYSPTDHITCGTSGKLIVVRTEVPFAGGIRVTGTASTLGGTILASMGNSPMNTSSRGGD